MAIVSNDFKDKLAAKRVVYGPFMHLVDPARTLLMWVLILSYWIWVFGANFANIFKI